MFYSYEGRVLISIRYKQLYHQRNLNHNTVLYLPKNNKIFNDLALLQLSHMDFNGVSE